jgi:chemotaxis protein MotB
LRKKRRPAEHVNHERWLVSYADFVTLLFAFFVVLYASSQVDKRKVGSLAMAIQVAFQQMGVFDSSNTKIPLSDSAAPSFSQIQVVTNSEPTGDFRRFVQPMNGILAAHSSKPLQDVQTDLMHALAPEIQKHIVTVTARPDGIVVSLRETGFYESGSATIRASSQGAIDRLVAILQARSDLLRIEGHTDNIPIHNRFFDSNWELSTARASQLVKLFIVRYDVAASRLSAAGFAQYHPVAPNDTEEGRARNRRVDIVILNPTHSY